MPQAYKMQKLHTAAVALADGETFRGFSEEGAYKRLFVQIKGITTATITWECSIDGTNWTGILLSPVTTGTGALTATADGIWQLLEGVPMYFRARISAWTSGAITVTAYGVM